MAYHYQNETVVQKRRCARSARQAQRIGTAIGTLLKQCASGSLRCTRAERDDLRATQRHMPAVVNKASVGYCDDAQRDVFRANARIAKIKRAARRRKEK